jgi:hypothetical protein
MKHVFSLVLFAAVSVPVAFADQKLSQPLTIKDAMPLSALMAAPSPYVGKTVQVKGKVTEVCEMAGCWMNLTDDDGHLLRIKVDDGVLVFPKDSVGKRAIAEGKLEKHEMTRDQLIAEAKHESEESGRKFNPAKIKSGKTVYQIAGSGALILDR